MSSFSFILSLFLFFCFNPDKGVHAGTPVPIYQDTLLSTDWSDWSWGGVTVNYNSITPVPQAGTTSALVTISTQYTGFYLHSAASYSASSFQSFTGYIYVPNSATISPFTVINSFGVQLQENGVGVGVSAKFNTNNILPGNSLLAGTWTQFTLSFATLYPSLVTTDSFNGFIFQLQSSTAISFSLDSLFVQPLTGPLPPTPPPTTPPPTTAMPISTVDLAKNRRPINLDVYGVNFATTNLINKVTLNRSGGNSKSRYNWRTDSHAIGSDWFFFNVADYNSGVDTSKFPSGTTSDLFLQSTFNAGGTAIITMPLMGYVSAGPTKTWSYSIKTHGAQQSNECAATNNVSWCTADAGNGIDTNGNPLRTTLAETNSVPFGPADGVAWIQHIAATFPNVDLSKHLIIAMDNEPMLWSSTHQDLHFSGTTYDELWTATQNMASALKAAFPNIRISGPTLFGWCAYLYSGLDSCGKFKTDYANHNNTYFLPWYMAKVNAYYQAHGVQLVDIIDLHSYPEKNNAGAKIGLSETDDFNTITDRLAFSRFYWDTSYVIDNWIGSNYGSIALIPKIRSWMAQYAPNIKFDLSFSEWNQGADDLFDAALGIIDLLGVFGWQGVDHATRWVAPVAGSVCEQAFYFYLNYDGQGSRVTGDSTSVTSTIPNGQMGIYSIHNSTTSTLYLVVVNKQSVDSSLALFLSSFSLTQQSPTSTVYAFSSTNKLVVLVSPNPVSLSVFNSASNPAVHLSFNIPSYTAYLVILTGIGLSTPTTIAPSATVPPTTSIIATTSPSTVTPTTLPSTSTASTAVPTTIPATTVVATTATATTATSTTGKATTTAATTAPATTAVPSSTAKATTAPGTTATASTAPATTATATTMKTTTGIPTTVISTTSSPSTPTVSTSVSTTQTVSTASPSTVSPTTSPAITTPTQSTTAVPSSTLPSTASPVPTTGINPTPTVLSTTSGPSISPTSTSQPTTSLTPTIPSTTTTLPSTASTTAQSCTDTLPSNYIISCRNWKAWGQCGSTWLTGSGYCRSTCGMCNAGNGATITCGNNQCESIWGYCGTGPDFCGQGCQSGPCYSTTTTTSPPISIDSDSPPIGAISLGCIADNLLRTLPINIGSSPYMTPRFCIQQAKAQGYDYAGVEYGIQCWASSSISLSSLEVMNDNMCNKACGGDVTLMCGGAWALNAYNITNVPLGGLSNLDLNPMLTPNNANYDNGSSNSSGLSLGVLIAVIVGGSVLLILLLVGLVFLCIRLRNRQQERKWHQHWRGSEVQV